MAFFGVHDSQTLRARPGQQALRRFDRHPQVADVIAQSLAEPAGFDEIALHVDQDQRGVRRPEPVRTGARRDLEGVV